MCVCVCELEVNPKAALSHKSETVFYSCSRWHQIIKAITEFSLGKDFLPIQSMKVNIIPSINQNHESKYKNTMQYKASINHDIVFSFFARVLNFLNGKSITVWNRLWKRENSIEIYCIVWQQFYYQPLILHIGFNQMRSMCNVCKK